MRILISACLLGVGCRYDGRSKACEEAVRLAEKHELAPVCPEQLGGLPTPREPAEIRDGGVYTASGRDVTENYRRGADETVKIARALGCGCAVLKERSPSCGSGEVHNGRFDGGMTPGDGVTAAALRKNGVKVYGESEIWKIK